MIDHLATHPIGAIHLAAACIALIAGACVLQLPKGTVLHRWLGRTYSVGMLAINLSALAIYELFGRFGPFHVLALLSLLSLAAGVLPALRRRPGWMQRHARFITGSYIGLCAAAVAEISSHMLAFPFGPSVFLGSAAVIVVGVAWMRHSLAKRFPVMTALR